MGPRHLPLKEALASQLKRHGPVLSVEIWREIREVMGIRTPRSSDSSRGDEIDKADWHRATAVNGENAIHAIKFAKVASTNAYPDVRQSSQCMSPSRSPWFVNKPHGVRRRGTVHVGGGAGRRCGPYEGPERRRRSLDEYSRTS